MSKALSVIIGVMAITASLSAQQADLEKNDSTRTTDVNQAGSTQWARPTKRVLTSREIGIFPFRGLQSYLPLLPGVVGQNGNLYLRGGRAGEVGYLLDGVSVTNRFFNNEGVTLIPEAIDQIEVYTGPYEAEYGGANAGLVQSRMRTGGEKFEYSLRIESDDFAKPGKELLGTTAFGYRNIVGTLSGSLPYGVKMFLAAEHHYLRNRQAMFLEPFRKEGLVTDSFGVRPPGTPLPGSIDFKRNYLPNNWYWKNTLQGNLLRKLNPHLELRLTGSYSLEKNPEGGNWPAALENYFRQRRNMLNETKTLFGSLRASHSLSPKISYSLSLSFYDRFAELSDPDFGDNWQLYADSAANAKKGYGGFTSRYRGPSSYSTIFMFLFNHPNSPNTRYTKNSQSNLSASIDFASELSGKWDVRGGAAVELWEMRSYSIPYIPYLMEYLNGFYGSSPRKFSSDLERRIYLARYGGIDFYGYDVDGNQVNSGLDAPRKPRFFSSYLQNNIRSQDLKLSVGIRYDVYDLRMPMPQDIEKPPVDYQFNWIDESKLIEQESMSVFLPRFRASFRLSENISVSAAFGKYAQIPSLATLVLSPLGLNTTVNPSVRSSFAYFRGLVPGYFLKPEKSTHYEVALEHEVMPGVAVQIAGYYKELIDQAQLAFHDTTVALPWLVIYKNDGAGNVKGIELTLTYRRAKRFATTFYYTLSEARGKGSYPGSNAGPLEYYSYRRPWQPEFDSPLDYDQTHRGLLVADYRFQSEDGSFLDGTGITFLLTFNSGHRYSKEEEIASCPCAATPWNIGVYSLIDPRAVALAEPPNSSTTPWVWNLDLQISRRIQLSSLSLNFFLNILNVLNSKHVLNVYPKTGSPDDDSWLRSRVSEYFTATQGYAEFYKVINLQNRWAYMRATGNDIYGVPRQIRVGLKLEM